MARVDTSKMKCNQVRSSTKQGKKRMVLACAGGKKRLIHFGADGYEQFNYPLFYPLDDRVYLFSSDRKSLWRIIREYILIIQTLFY